MKVNWITLGFELLDFESTTLCTENVQFSKLYWQRNDPLIEKNIELTDPLLTQNNKKKK